MAGNALSVMGITTKGRGGHVPETLPRSARKRFTINNRPFRCTKCGVVIVTLTYKDVQNCNRCPGCGEYDCLVTVNTLKPVRTRNAEEKAQRKFEIANMISFIKKNSQMSAKELAEEFNMPYQNLIYYIRKFKLKVADGRKKSKATVN